MQSSSGTWDDAKWTRYGYLGGVVFVALGIASAFVAGSPPARDASAEKIAEYFLDNEGGIKLAATLFGLSILFGVWFLGSLWRRIGRLEPGGPRLAFIVVIGFVMSGAAALVSQALFTAPAMRPDTLVGTTEFVWEVGYLMFAISMGALAAHLLAIGALVQWTKFVPAWTAYIAYLAALCALAGVIGAGSDASIFGVLQLLGFLLWMLWILIASIVLYTGKGASA
jgi:hypothetical protein